MMEIYFIAAFVICIAMYVLHTESHYSGSRGRKPMFPEKLISLSVTISYFAWFFMIFSDPFRIATYSFIQIPLGLAIGIIGLVIISKAHKQKDGFKETDSLVTKGMYSRMRHPIYYGMLLAYVGFPLAAGSMLTLASSFVWLGFIIIWIFWEEKGLLKRFGKEYVEYKKKTVF